MSKSFATFDIFLSGYVMQYAHLTLDFAVAAP